ncbi:hypothetical protein EAH87_17305 [Sphingomonas koreensis]|nr:hypothetical protein EAH87_17305 [Sphingomonas koreensis]
MRIGSAATLALAAASFASGAVAADRHRPIGKETTIAFASNGGIRNWEAGPPKSKILYVQDRRLDWYRVELSGPCLDRNRGDMTINYTTDAIGAFDRFSTLTFPNAGYTVCGVKSIQTSLPPPGQPGAQKPGR